MRRIVYAFAVLALGLTQAGASPFGFLHGGSPGGGGTSPTFACDGAGTGVCVDFVAGQAYVTWPDVATGATGANFRYRLYRSNSVLNSGNCTAGSKIASYVFNNSGQQFGGNPNLAGGTPFCQHIRQADGKKCDGSTSVLGDPANNPMSTIPDAQAGGGATKLLAYWTGLQVYTALAPETAYYCVVSTDTADGSPSYLGAVGPISETVATPAPIKVADSATRPNSGGFGIITSGPSGCNNPGPPGCPVVILAQASNASGGAAGGPGSIWGDYWEWWGDTAQGYQDGRATAVQVDQDNGGHFPSQAHTIEVRDRDTIWSTPGTGALENYHFGDGFTPNTLVGAANRFYPHVCTMYQKSLTFVQNNYGTDPNNVHWFGDSLGAFGGVLCGIHTTSPKMGSAWLLHPRFRLNWFRTTSWTGELWGAGAPFSATVGAAPSTLGTIAANVVMADGSSWVNWVDSLIYLTASPGTDISFFGWTSTKDDPNYNSTGPGGFQEFGDTVIAAEAAHRGYAATFSVGMHDTDAFGPIDCDGFSVNSATCYNKSLFKLNIPYIAFGSSAINDDYGTGTRDANGILDGADLGCENCGFKWTVTSDTSGGFNFTVRNVWMGLSPTTVSPATTLTQLIPLSGGGTFSVGSTAGWLGVAGNNNTYVRVGNEIVLTGHTLSTITISARARSGTTAAAHAIGETVTQYRSTPTGPNGGPYATMTADMTPRRVQNFHPADGATVACNGTTFGGTVVSISATVGNGIWTLPAVPIDVGGVTTLSCS